MTCYGYVRIAVLWRGKTDESSYGHGYDILMVDAFEHDKLLSSGKNCSGSTWIEEEVSDDYNNWIGDFLKDKPLGFYEILGRFFYVGWASGYEYPEYECAWELRHVKFNHMTYDQARDMDNNGILEDQEHKLLDTYRCEISPYMPKRQIMINYANALGELMRGWWSGWGSSPRTNVDNHTDKELQDYIWMLTMEIDSEELKYPERAKRANAMHDMVKEVLAEHEEFNLTHPGDEPKKTKVDAELENIIS